MKSQESRSNRELTAVLQLLSGAGVGRYPVGPEFGELLPNVDGALGEPGLELREAIAELTWEPTNKAKQAVLQEKLRQWHAAVAARERALAAGGAVSAEEGVPAPPALAQYDSSVASE